MARLDHRRDRDRGQELRAARAELAAEHDLQPSDPPWLTPDRPGEPVICTSGSPAAAGLFLLDRVALRCHGDFDWPGIAIARRIIARGATPWRLGQQDYLEATARLRPIICSR